MRYFQYIVTWSNGDKEIYYYTDAYVSCKSTSLFNDECNRVEVNLSHAREIQKRHKYFWNEGRWDCQGLIWLIILGITALASSCRYEQKTKPDYTKITKDSVMMSQSPTQWGDISFKRHWSPHFNHPDSIHRVWVTAYDSIIIVDDTEYFGRWLNKAIFQLENKGMVFISPTDFIIRDSNTNLVYKAWDRY